MYTDLGDKDLKSRKTLKTKFIYLNFLCTHSGFLDLDGSFCVSDVFLVASDTLVCFFSVVVVLDEA